MMSGTRWRHIVGIAILTGGLSCSNTQDRPAGSGAPMYKLHIALHDGFKANRVTITADGRNVYDNTAVTTNLAISRADALDITVNAKTARLHVLVEPGGNQASTEIDVTQFPFVAISREQDGSIVFQPSSQSFRYM
jgi:hypothetical protein